MITLSSTPTILEDNKFQLHLEVTNTSHLPEEVFLFRVDLEGSEIFSAICTVRQINEVGLFAEVGQPFFRKSETVLVFDTVKKLEEFLEDTKVQLEQLDKDFQATLDELKVGETTVFILNELS